MKPMYAQSYIDALIDSDPTWLTCVSLHGIAPSHELGRMMGGLAAALRSGSEITHIDWGDDWISLSTTHLDGMEPLRELSSARRYRELDQWLQANEEMIICKIHKAYSEQIQKQTEPDR